jgi:hypothetical protein
MGHSTHFVGLLSGTRDLHGVACFGHGPWSQMRGVIGRPALCLERGACVHYAPANAASFLINNACKLLYRIHGVARFFAYADPKAGEYGGVYQAAGWVYLGQGLDGVRNRRKQRYQVLRPGRDPDIETNWQTTRELRRDADKAKHLTFRSAEENGWQIRLRAGKHVYATHVGRDRRKWRRTIAALPYPAPEPELKLKTSAVFRLAKPIPIQSDMFEDQTP